MKTIGAIIFASLIFLQTLYAKELSVLGILDEMIIRYGGEESLKQLNSYKQIWNVETKMGNSHGTDTREIRLPNFLKVELVYPNRSEIRILDHAKGIKKYPNKTIEAKGPMLDAMKLQLMRLYTPLELKKRAKDIKVLEDDNFYVLILEQDNLVANYFVSKKDYYISLVIGELSMNGSKMEFRTFYEDYAITHGVMMPHKEIKYAGSVNTAILRLKEVSFF